MSIYLPETFWVSQEKMKKMNFFMNFTLCNAMAVTKIKPTLTAPHMGPYSGNAHGLKHYPTWDPPPFGVYPIFMSLLKKRREIMHICRYKIPPTLE